MKKIFIQRERGCSWSNTFRICDTLIRFGDISHKQKSYGAHIKPTQAVIFGRLHFGPWGVLPLKFLHALQIDQDLLAHTITVDEAPPEVKI